MKAFHEVRNYNSDLMVWHSSYENISFVAHWQKEIELVYVKDGEASFHVADQSFIARTGDLVICESGQIHYSDSYNTQNHLDFLIFDTNVISSRYHNPHFKNVLVTAEELEEMGLNTSLERVFSLVARELDKKQPYYKDIITAAIREFWFLLKRELPREEKAKDDRRRSRLLEEFQELLDYIDKHYAEDLTLDHASSMLHFSPSHFSKTFKKLMGMNYVTYVNMVRIEQAIQMLTTNQYRMIDIALECGFSNIRSFNRVFKEITGYTPTDFSAQVDPDLYKTTYYHRKSGDTEYVEGESTTMRPNFS
jgi:YesN/AraC family two-component response regulator